MTSIWTVFLTGLITGGLTCLAVQGGLLAATLAQQEEERLKHKTQGTGNALPILAFLVAKLVAYTALGFLLGWFGSIFQLSIGLQVFMMTAVAIFMIGTALNILDVHPIFRYFVIQPPRSITRIVRNQAKSRSIFAPALLGAFTVFIPCGTTQAMMALAIASGSPVVGAMILFAFVLGTSPLFFILGYFATRLGDALHQKFMRIAGYVLIMLALYNLNAALTLSGSRWTLENLLQPQQVSQNFLQQPVQDQVLISVQPYGYSPDVVTVNSGQDVTFTIENQDTYTCAAAFTIPFFNYQKVIEVGKRETIILRMPDYPTEIPFMCSMGMYRGVIRVI